MYMVSIAQKKNGVDSTGSFTYTDSVTVKFAFMMDLQKFVDLIFTANDDLTITIESIPDEDDENNKEE